jgi:hypothetical protein
MATPKMVGDRIVGEKTKGDKMKGWLVRLKGKRNCYFYLLNLYFHAEFAIAGLNRDGDSLIWFLRALFQ